MIREAYRNNVDMANPTRLLLIEGEDRCYREVVLQRGDDIVDIVYDGNGIWAKGDMDMIRVQLVTYGFEEAKRLAEHYKQHREKGDKK